MASYKELQFEWSILFQQQDYDQWTQTDLQLAAELGKTLLERNKELESLLKDHKATIEEQEQEIVYLKKHTTALREVNDSRLKVYEQLEVGIQDLERANHRLLVENTSDKKHIKTLLQNVETLEARADELTKQLEETRQLLSIERRKNERLLQERNAGQTEGINIRLRPVESAGNASGSDSVSETGYNANMTAPENCSFAFRSPGNTSRESAHAGNSTGISSSNESQKSMAAELSFAGLSGEENEEIIKLVNDLESTRKAFLAEQQRCGELEEQLVAIIQENQSLQGRLAQTSANEEMKSMQEELSILDEVRQGQMCSRCLRAVEERATINDEQSSIAPTEEDVLAGDNDDERSLLDDDTSECNSQAADAVRYRSGVGIKKKFKNSIATATTITANTPVATATTLPTSQAASGLICHICKNPKIKYLHEQMPISLETLSFEVWQKMLRKLRFVQWIARLLQWPAVVICRMIEAIPLQEDFSLVF